MTTKTIKPKSSAEQMVKDIRRVTRRTFYRWYDRYLNGGPEALKDRSSAPSRNWHRIPTGIHDQVIEMALEHSELSRRELAVLFTDATERRAPLSAHQSANLSQSI